LVFVQKLKLLLYFSVRIIHILPMSKICLAALALFFLTGCSHKYASNVLDLNFYQWNLWHDVEAALEDEAPSCGWEELDRGNGKLVRIPSLIKDQYPAEKGMGIYWYHCRYSLPENWEDREIALRFEGVSPILEVYLNGNPIGSNLGNAVDFEIDVTDVIYYTRDNHLALRVIIMDENQWDGAGIAGTVLVKSVPTEPEKAP